MSFYLDLIDFTVSCLIMVSNYWQPNDAGKISHQIHPPLLMSNWSNLVLCIDAQKDLDFRNLVSTTHTDFQGWGSKGQIHPSLVQGWYIRRNLSMHVLCWLKKLTTIKKWCIEYLLPLIQGHLCPKSSEQRWQLVNKDVWALFFLGTMIFEWAGSPLTWAEVGHTWAILLLLHPDNHILQ